MDPHKVAWFRPNPLDEEIASISQENLAQATFQIQQFVIQLTEEDVEDTRLRKLEQDNKKPAMFPACLIPLTTNIVRDSTRG